MACLTTNENPNTDGCCGIATSDPTGYTLCQAASACMRAGGPPVGLATSVVTRPLASAARTCRPATIPEQANGPCVAQMTAAAARNVMTKTTDTPNATQVLARQGDPVYALGRAANIHVIAGAFCPIECGIGQ